MIIEPLRLMKLCDFFIEGSKLKVAEGPHSHIYFSSVYQLHGHSEHIKPAQRHDMGKPRKRDPSAHYSTSFQ